jgi:hypothetical protein
MAELSVNHCDKQINLEVQTTSHTGKSQGHFLDRIIGWGEGPFTPDYGRILDLRVDAGLGGVFETQG